jgi:Tol biopolymer transport system component
MKCLDRSTQGFTDMTWSPDGRRLAWVKDFDSICVVDVDEDASPIMVASGTHPAFTADGTLLLERKDEIFRTTASGDRRFIGLNELLDNTPKRMPFCSPDGKRVIFVVDNIFHKESQSRNAYPYRTFLAMASTDDAIRPALLPHQQWCGGTISWMPNDNSGFLHYEYDSTAGARIHMVDAEGNTRMTTFGLFPAMSPDGRRLACKPKGGQNIVVYTRQGDLWEREHLDTAVCRLPEGGRLTGSSPLWLDNRYLLVDEGGKVFRVDSHKQRAEEITSIPAPALRGSETMCLSPDRTRLALERDAGDAFELCLVSIG